LSPALNEDTLVQETTATYLQHDLGWDENIYAMKEVLGPEGTLGRKSETEVILSRYLGEALIRLNPGLPNAAYQDALRQITEVPITHGTLQINREKYELVKSGVQVQYRDAKNELVKKRLRVIDWDDPDNNHFLCLREFWIKGDLYRRRADIVGFVNGLPLLFIECKAIHKDIRHAYDGNLADYKDTVPHLFHHNAFIVLGNGVQAKIGSLSSQWEHFNDWKRLSEGEPGVVEMETLLKGVCDKRNFLDLFENFILFDETPNGLIKIVARNHQFLGVNQAIAATEEREARQGKLGVFWHTQGSGKSYSIVFYTQKIHRKIGSNFTFLICTDRTDLDGQLYKTFAGCGIVDNDQDPCRAGSGQELRGLLSQHKAFVFTLIQKFNEKLAEGEFYSDRDDIIIITDEAHRTQYGTLSLNLRDALPNASRIGFTGTPLFADDEITRRVFGEYVSKYDFQRAVEDGATVPLYYDARGEELQVATKDLNEKIAAKLEDLEIADQDVAERLENELKRDYHVITSPDRLDKIARDFVVHYSTQWETGKAMFVCIDKITAVRMHSLIVDHWAQRITELERDLSVCDEQERADRERQLDWMRETLMAVVVSEEQGEVARFKTWNLDILPHRRLHKDGFETEDGKRLDVESAFKQEDHPFRVAIVCAMWLTGFDVPSLSTLYLDKPLKAHTLMQAIARANRVHEGKNNGLVVDYCGILTNLRKALATFTGPGGGGGGGGGGGEGEGPPPIRPDEELLAELAEAIQAVRDYLSGSGFELSDILTKTGFDRNKTIIDAKEIINENDESRKRYQIMAREVFKKFKACLNLNDVRRYRDDRDAINVIYKSLDEDVKQADISDIIKQLHEVVGDAVAVSGGTTADGKIYDISQIDFERLRQEFAGSSQRNTTVQSLKDAVEKRLQILLRQNPLRTDFQTHYERIVYDYNQEKNRVTIEQTFEALLKLVQELSDEEQRAVREGLGDEETLALFDLLMKPELSASDIDRIKKVATGLHEVLTAEVERVQDFHAKQATRDAMRTRIHDYLYDEASGLPESFTLEEIDLKADHILAHVLLTRRIDKGLGPRF
jgi:type I restriction enzyme R subunit